MVLFLYLHVYFHLKTSSDLEIYEIDQPSKDKLEEICDLRQPVLFRLENDNLMAACRRETVRDVYGAFDVKIRNTSGVLDDDEELYVPLPFSSALEALKEDKSSKYLVENNADFLEETGMIKGYRYNDAFIRPYLVSNCIYDYTMGAAGVRTPFRYDLNYRNYYYVVQGCVKIKLAPPRSTRYLYQIKDYENFEFRSPVNPWNVQAQYRPDFDKIKCLEVAMKEGQILFIPAFWWYSVEYEEETTLCTLKYRTYMNNVAILPYLFMRLLQSQNVKRNIVPHLSFDQDESEKKSEKESEDPEPDQPAGKKDEKEGVVTQDVPAQSEEET
jgi:hypothetical protein